jgi:hypothetical protein
MLKEFKSFPLDNWFNINWHLYDSKKIVLYLFLKILFEKINKKNVLMMDERYLIIKMNACIE